MNQVLLIILDGFGIAPEGRGNAVTLAAPQNINSFLHLYPNTELKASGEAVGLPAGEVGSTEVGHLNIGAGRVVYQNLPRINMSIADGTYYALDTFREAAEHVEKTGGDFHIIGLLSEQYVHASKEHLYALLHFCKEKKVKNVYIHVITDGRDSPPRAAKQYMDELDEIIKKIHVGTIASVMGRFYAMDRDKRWERTEKAYRCLTDGTGQQATSWLEVIDSSYKKNITDEFVEPTNIVKDDKPLSLIKKGDSAIFFNYRIDRPRQLTKAFVLDNFAHDANITTYDPYATKYYGKHLVDEKVLGAPFERGHKIDDLFFVTMTEYEKDLTPHVAFPPHGVRAPLGKIISENKLKQLRLAESEKERFVTFYFSGLHEGTFDLEDRLIVPSPKVPTYDKKPEMSALEITDVLINKMEEKKYSFILVNYANTDMVGHTGNLQAAIKSVKIVDECLGRVVEAALKTDTTVLITGDHGNVEEMIDLVSGNPSTEHTSNPVYFIAINNKLQGQSKKLQSGILADIAPTVLALLGIVKSADMTGRNLLEDV